MKKAAAAPAPGPVEPAAPSALPVGVSGEEAAEAHGMKAQGKDARAIGEWFGWSMEATHRVLAYRLPQRGAAA
jgi:hypothetical protein